MSAWGSASSRAWSAASPGLAPPRTAWATPWARIGVDPMFTRPTPVRSPSTTAATPTMAQSGAGVLGDLDLGEQLVGLEGRLEEAQVEVGGGDPALAGRAAGHQRGAQGQDHGGQVGGRVGVGQRAADGAAVADLGVAHL